MTTSVRPRSILTIVVLTVGLLTLLEYTVLVLRCRADFPGDRPRLVSCL